MTLRRGTGRKTVSANIRKMRRAGHPQKQAVAAALNTARKSAASGGPRRTTKRKSGRKRR